MTERTAESRALMGERNRLAGAIDRMTAEARLVTALRDYRPLLTPEVVLACEALLAEVAQLLREERRPASPGALERLELLVDPLTSPLAGSDPARALAEAREILERLR